MVVIFWIVVTITRLHFLPNAYQIMGIVRFVDINNIVSGVGKEG